MDLNKALRSAAADGGTATAEIQLAIASALDKGANINATDDEGATALHIACKLNKIDIVTLLIVRGAVIECRDAESRTPLHVACESGNIAIVKLLLESSVAIGAIDENGWTALHHVCYKGHSDIALLLLAKGADISCRTSTGLTALHLSCYFGYLDLILLLVNNGCPINARNTNGDTALHIACKYFKIVAKLLIKQKADIYIRNNDGKTALDMNRRPEWREELIQLYEEINRDWLARRPFLFVLIGCKYNSDSGLEYSGSDSYSPYDRARDDVLRLMHRHIASYL